MDAWLLVALAVLAVIYGIIIEFENQEDGIDPIIEAKCKECISYEGCQNHGRKYGCKEYMTEEMLKRKGVGK